MRKLQVRFSVRTLLISLAVVANLLTLAVRWGPHATWRILNRQIATGIVPVPVRPLAAQRTPEEWVQCRVGPFRLELPKSMAGQVQVRRGVGIGLLFQDDHRILQLNLTSSDRSPLTPLDDFPEKVVRSYPQLFAEFMSAGSQDFSYSMSRSELRWHQWLLQNRSLAPEEIQWVEYCRKGMIDGNLISLPRAHFYHWATHDGQGNGTIHFRTTRTNELDWMRYACTTLSLDGDPTWFQRATDDEILAKIQISPAEGNADSLTRTK